MGFCSKRLIRRIECRLKLLNSKRRAIVRQVRDDVGLLLKVGHDQTVFTRVEQLYMDEIILTVYELLGHFCEFISINLSYICRHKQCPNDVNEAISSLIFASARCGEVPELRTFRDLIEERYGRRYVRTALELLPGNFVNPQVDDVVKALSESLLSETSFVLKLKRILQVKEKLSVTSVSDDAKFRMVNEIFREYCLQPASLAIQYSQEWHQKQVLEFASGTNSLSEDCFSLQARDLANTNGNNQAGMLPPQEPVMVHPVSEMEKLAGISRVPSSSCSDISVHLPDENLVYLDDVEEFRSPKLYDCSSPDTRIFMFKSSPLVNVQSGRNELQSQMKVRLRKSFNRSRSLRRRPSLRERDLLANNNKLLQQKYPREVLENITEPFSAKRGKFQSQVINGVGLGEDTAKLRTQFLEQRDQKQRSHYTCHPDLIAEQASGINKKSEVMEKRMTYEDNLYSPISSKGSNSVESALTNKSTALTFYVKDAETRYLRAFTLPAERPKDQGLEMYSRTSSLPVPNHANHVHPKLPDYDQIEAKFSALKHDYQHTQCH
ncbi:unnamed protein product [Rhodiola kirilowii]